MALPELTQAEAILKRAGSVLLIVPPRTSGDAFASMVAFYMALQNRPNVKIDEVSPSHVPRSLQFLPGSSQTLTQPEKRPQVVVDMAGPTVLSGVRPEGLNGGMRLHISFPEGTTITKDQVEITVRPMPYDVVITFGVSDLEALGDIYTNQADFFFNTPIINIDYRADNEHYGTVNIVDITASCVAQVTYELIKHLNPAIESDVATALYAGIVAGTDSFQKPSTKPSVFQMAAELINHKADRDAVIQHLVKTKPLSLLKLVGRLYARLRYNEHVKLFSSVVREADFAESEADPEELVNAIHELTNNISDFSAAYVIHEHGEHYDVYVVLGKGLKQRRLDIQSALGATKLNGFLKFSFVSASLPEAEKLAEEKIVGATK
jgi:nanoRNase/pAp phosphatase (c-di-AMP/oligoRNAs hydrolase)